MEAGFGSLGPITSTGSDILPLVSAVATSISAVFVGATVLLAGRQLYRTRRATAVTTMVQLIRDWESAGGRARRQRAASKLRASPSAFDIDGLDLLNTFEVLAYLVLDARVVGEREAWTAFCDPLTLYVGAFRPTIEAFRRQDGTYFDNLLDLHARMLRYDARERKLSVAEVTPSEARLQSFLEEEASLPTDPGEPRQVTFRTGTELNVRRRTRWR